jgi:hypothetical protein
MTPMPRYANLALKRCSENRERAFAMSAATVGKLKMHPPVPRERALVVIQEPEHSSPGWDYDEELAYGFDLKYGQ